MADNRPSWPWPDVVHLYPGRNGQWQKRVRGKLLNFGPLADPQAALENWRRLDAAMRAGADPRGVDYRQPQSAALTVGELVNLWLASKLAALKRGDLRERSYEDYRDLAGRIIDGLGRNRAAADIGPRDFAALLESWSAYGPDRRRKLVSRVRMIWDWGWESGELDKPPRYGPDFRGPGRRVAEARKAEAREMTFDACDLRRMIAQANPAMRAAVLLGVNGGFGPTDCAELRFADLDLEGGWIRQPRHKTGVARRIWLWPETRLALQAAVDARAEPADKAAADLALLTRYGRPWVQGRTYPVLLEFRKLARGAGCWRSGLSFYSLKRTFATVADEAGDEPAKDVVNGHVTPGMGRRYVQRIADGRVQMVCEHVRRWLYEIRNVAPPGAAWLDSLGG